MWGLAKSQHTRNWEREKKKHLHTLFIPLSSLRITTFVAHSNVGQLSRSEATGSMRERAHEKFIKPFKRGQVMVDINNGGRAELSSSLRGADLKPSSNSGTAPFGPHLSEKASPVGKCQSAAHSRGGTEGARHETCLWDNGQEMFECVL